MQQAAQKAVQRRANRGKLAGSSAPRKSSSSGTPLASATRSPPGGSSWVASAAADVGLGKRGARGRKAQAEQKPACESPVRPFANTTLDASASALAYLWELMSGRKDEASQAWIGKLSFSSLQGQEDA